MGERTHTLIYRGTDGFVSRVVCEVVIDQCAAYQHSSNPGPLYFGNGDCVPQQEISARSQTSSEFLANVAQRARPQNVLQHSRGDDQIKVAVHRVLSDIPLGKLDIV